MSRCHGRRRRRRRRGRRSSPPLMSIASTGPSPLALIGASGRLSSSEPSISSSSSRRSGGAISGSDMLAPTASTIGPSRSITRRVAAQVDARAVERPRELLEPHVAEHALEHRLRLVPLDQRRARDRVVVDRVAPHPLLVAARVHRARCRSPRASRPPMNAPMLTPPTRSTITPASSSTSSTPRCANARAPPPLSTTPTRAPSAAARAIRATSPRARRRPRSRTRCAGSRLSTQPASAPDPGSTPKPISSPPRSACSGTPRRRAVSRAPRSGAATTLSTRSARETQNSSHALVPRRSPPQTMITWSWSSSQRSTSGANSALRLLARARARRAAARPPARRDTAPRPAPTRTARGSARRPARAAGTPADRAQRDRHRSRAPRRGDRAARLKLCAEHAREAERELGLGAQQRVEARPCRSSAARCRAARGPRRCA